MAITRQNINTQQMPADYNQCCCGKKKQDRQIVIYKNRKAAENFIAGMVIPTSALDTVFYRDENRNLKCLLVVGNLPGSAPFIFENSPYATSNSEDSSAGGSGTNPGGSGGSGSGGSGGTSDEIIWEGEFDSSTVSWDVVVTPDDDESEHVYVDTEAGFQEFDA